MTSKKQYNNGKWNTVVISHKSGTGTLLINGDDEVTGTSFGVTKITTVRAPYSFGELAPFMKTDLAHNIALDPKKYFQGCIRNIQVSDTPWGEPQTNVGTIPCSENTENGVYFNGGYLKVNNFFFYLNTNDAKNSILNIVKIICFFFFILFKSGQRFIQGWRRNDRFI